MKSLVHLSNQSQDAMRRHHRGKKNQQSDLNQILHDMTFSTNCHKDIDQG